MKKGLKTLLVASLLCGTLMSVSCQNEKSSETTQGSKSYQGEGKPENSLGVNGDTYTDTSTGEVYDKKDGQWVLRTKELSGKGVPSDSYGNDGDRYTDTDYDDVYEKRDGHWVLVQKGDKVVEHIVHFDLNGGRINGLAVVDDVPVRHGLLLTKPKVEPVKEHCIFKGWYLDGEKFSFATPIYNDMTLTAMYDVDEESKITLYVDPNNGGELEVIETFVGDTPSIKIPTNPGYDFKGWYFEGTNDKFGGYITSDMNGLTIVAKWEKSKFAFTYETNIAGDEITITGVRDAAVVQIVIPERIDGVLVTGFTPKAFQNRSKLIEVTLPASIKNFYATAFKGDRLIQRINIDPTNTNLVSVEGVVYTKDMTELLYVGPKNTTSFVVPNTVKKIGEAACYGHDNEGITSITFNEGLEEIGKDAFCGNTGLSVLDFPSTLKKIGDGAFNTYTQGSITRVNFNEGLEEIGEAAFAGAYFKDTFTLPSTVKTIKSYAFANCTAIEKLVLPKGLIDLQPAAFNGSTGIKTVSVDPANTAYTVVGNVVYNKAITKAVYCPSNNTDPIVIPEGVTEIGDDAFYMVDETQSYTFPSTLTKIGYQAFAHCYGLKSFTIPDTVSELGEQAFDMCTKLTSLTIGSGIREIPTYCFAGAQSLTTINIPSNVVTIGENAFYDARSLTTINFSEGVKTIKQGAFTFVKAYEDDYSMYKSQLTSLTLPNSLEAIEDGAFYARDTLANISIGSGLKDFNINAFDTTALNGITLSSANPYLTYSNGTLYNKAKTKILFTNLNTSGQYDIPATVTEIGDYAFANRNITEVNFNGALTKVGVGAFHNTHITTVTLPSSMRTIEEGAFTTNGITSVTFNEGLETIGDYAFSSTGITTVTLPNSVITIGNSAFQMCNKITSLTLGENITSIGERAFERCTSITGKVTLPKKLQTLGELAFGNLQAWNMNMKITDFAIDSSNTNFTIVDGMVMNKAQTEVYCYATGSTRTSLSVPATVKTIDTYAFYGAKTLSSLTLAEGLETINEKAFGYCTGIATLNVPASVTYVGNAAFDGWKSTQTVHFNCTEDYALKHFDTSYNSSGAKFTYEG